MSFLVSFRLWDIMCSLAPPLLLADQPTPNMFDHANSTTIFPPYPHHRTTIANWSTFQFENTIDTNHRHLL